MTPETSGATPLFRIDDVTRRYTMGDAVVHALRGVSLDIPRGDFLAIVGASGSGKSTLLHLLGLVDAPDDGRVFFDGRDVTRLDDRDATALRLRRIGLVFQRFYLMPTLTARENVELPMAEAGLARAARRRRADELLDYVGLAERRTHRPTQLSGGEQQRVAIARALANDPAVLLADEPTGELDAATGAAVLALFERLHADGLTCVLVTHDAQLAERAARVVTMRDGRMLSDERRR